MSDALEVSSLVSNIKNESPDCILSKKECPRAFVVWIQPGFDCGVLMFGRVWEDCRSTFFAKVVRYSAKQLTKGLGRFFKSKTDTKSEDKEATV